MMKTRKKLILIVCLTLICSLSLSFIGKGVIMFPIMYSNNANLEKSENDALKEIIISSIKDLFLIGKNPKMNDIYLSADSTQIIQFESSLSKSFICFFETDFMKNINKIDNQTYVCILETYFPERYICHIEIIVLNGEFKISKFQLDI